MGRVCFFSTLKPFDSSRSWDKHQESALYSWSLQPTLDFLIIGVDDERGHELIQKYGFGHIDEVLRANEIGYFSKCPILTDLMKLGLERCDSEWVGYINSDIILHPSFENSLSTLLEDCSQKGERPFITVRRRDFAMTEAILSKESVEGLVDSPWVMHPKTGSDIFIAKKSFWLEALTTMPDFIVGRYAWDNYLHRLAVVEGDHPVDASKSLISFHPHHGRPMDPTDPEMNYNQSLYNVTYNYEIFTLHDSRWIEV